jgi:orotidine-5'-phosphate decarboxylase
MPKSRSRNHEHTDLIVALDFPRADKALEIVDKFGDLPVIFKVGFELFMAAGPDFVRELVHRKCRVFLDLKFHDIPNTVAKAALQASLMHVEMFTVHLSGGDLMIKAAAAELAEIPALRPKMLGVSVLTSFDDVRWSLVTKSLTGHASDVSDSVLGLVEHASSWGVDGVVCSALELPMIREQFPSLYTVVPGIRPEGSSAGDQARVMTPAEAASLGASAVVVGRPITEAADPRKMAEAILKELSLAKISA